jgi:SAM-dependent methyltransferase
MGAEHGADLATVLARFPKERPALTPEIQAIYLRQYKENRSGRTPAASAAQRLERWMHRRVAADLAGGASQATLELGAGMLNQLPYERFNAPYDIVEPFRELYADAPDRGRVREVFADIADAPAERRYQRITSIAALEHMCDLPLVLARAARLLEPDGVLRVAYPSEGGFLWTLGWRLTTGLEFRLRHGLDYGIMMRHEHVNTAAEIETLVAGLFAEVRIRSFGWGRQLSLYRFLEARRPRLDVAAAWTARFQRPAGRRRKPVGSTST